MDTLKKLAAFGLGLIEVSEEKARALADEIIARGEAKQEEKEELARNLLQRAQAAGDAVKSYADKQVDAALKRMNLARREDLDKLAARVAELEARLKAGE